MKTYENSLMNNNFYFLSDINSIIFVVNIVVVYCFVSFVNII